MSYFDWVRDAKKLRRSTPKKIMASYLIDIPQHYSCTECGADINDEDVCYILETRIEIPARDLEQSGSRIPVYEKGDIFCAYCVEEATVIEEENR